MKLNELLDFALPVAAAVFAPELGISSALGAGLTSGGIETLRSHNLGRGVMSGLFAGGLSGILGGLPGSPAGAEQLAGPAEEAASGSMMDRMKSASLGDWGSAAFPKGAGALASPGLYAGLGGMGLMASNAQRDAMAQYEARRRAQQEALLGSAPTLSGATPYPNFNYMDPSAYLHNGRGGVPFTGGKDGGVVRGYNDGGLLGILPAILGNAAQHGSNLGGVLGMIPGMLGNAAQHNQIDPSLAAKLAVAAPHMADGGEVEDQEPVSEKEMQRNREFWSESRAIRKEAKDVLKRTDPEVWDRLKYSVGRYYDYFDPGTQQTQYAGTTAQMVRPSQYKDGTWGEEIVDETDRQWADDEVLQKIIDRQERMPRTRMAAGGLAALPGAQRDIKHRRSGASMLRGMYPDRQALMSDVPRPDSPAAMMGVQRQNDPLIGAAFPRQNGALVGGPGDGRSDSVPAMIDGQHPAALSSGEFVVPAHAVSALGRGSTHAGARKLQMMVDRTKKPRAPGMPV